MLLNDIQINSLCVGEKPMITPFVRENVKVIPDGKATRKKIDALAEANEPHPLFMGWEGKKVISYGLSSYGYDIRVADGFKIFTNLHAGIVDPKEFNETNCLDVYAMKDHDFIIVPPNSFALAQSVEEFNMPDNVLGLVYGKSTYARCGIITNVTPLEPGWRGTVTLEISNTTPLPAKIYINEGLCQVLFLQGQRPAVSYGDRNGKYQGQSGITLPRV